MTRHANIAIFIPHAGCAHRCSFCDQHGISGAKRPPSPAEVEKTVNTVMQNLGERVKESEIAFFGGSFTAMPIDYQTALLYAAAPFCGENGFMGIRLSTRPDCISEATLDLLSAYPVTAIELGAQSMDDAVLGLNRRGHSARDVQTASRLIHEHGFSLGLQMMIGLYGASNGSDRETAKSLAALNPDTMRIYPALTLVGTYLHELYLEGFYTPPSLDDSVELAAGLLGFFTDKNIAVIRLGLHDGEGLSSHVAAGPYHPAFRELCEGQILLGRALAQLNEKQIPPGNIILEVSPRDISKMAGQNRRNISKLNELGYNAKIRGRDDILYLNVDVSIIGC